MSRNSKSSNRDDLKSGGNASTLSLAGVTNAKENSTGRRSIDSFKKSLKTGGTKSFELTQPEKDAEKGSRTTFKDAEKGSRTTLKDAEKGSRTTLKDAEKGSRTTLAENESQSKKRVGSINKLKSQSGGDISREIGTHTMLSENNNFESGDLPTRTDTGLSILSAINTMNEDIPSIGHDLKYTKLFLQKQGINNLSIWSHLTDVLNKIIAEQPDNVIDYFEEYSKKVKQEKLIIYDTLRDIYIPPAQLESAKNQLLLLNSYEIKDDSEEPEAVGEEEEKVEPSKRMDLEEAAFYYRQTGLAIPDVQLFNLNIAIKKLAQEKNLIQPRFWGKLFGIKQDYFVLESELTDEEYEKRVEEEELAEAAEAERLAAEQEAEEERAKEISEMAEVEEQIGLSKKESLLKSDDQGTEGEIKEEPASNLTDESNQQEEQPIEEEKKVSFEIPPEEEGAEVAEGEEKEDPLLPPLPPPNKILKYLIPPILEPVLKEIVTVLPEKLGEGSNKKVYFVATTPELEWSELPKVTPDQINKARQIKVFFTGDLENKIFTYPSFPGTEKNYLRAQIARITAATQISPIGFYRFGEGGGDEEEEEEVPEEEEEAGDKKKITENPKFQPIPIRELTDPSLASWVHHSQHILKQGRTVWWGPKTASADEEEGEEEQEEEEEEEGGEKEGKESGPALLTPLSEDLDVEGHPAWSVRRTHNYNSEMAAAVVRSNLWPGASAFAVGKKFENVYFGWGHKHLPQGFSPVPLPHPEYEYDLGPEIMEIQDPTVEVEEAWRQAHKKKPPPAEGEEGEEAEEEEEEEDEDDD